MNSDEYHAVIWGSNDADVPICRFCGRDWSMHERSCPYGIPDGWDDQVARGREEDRVYGE